MRFPLDSADNVFNTVPDVEGQNTQFGLLPQMDALMVKQHRAGLGLAHQNERKQGHPVGIKPRKLND